MIYALEGRESLYMSITLIHPTLTPRNIYAAPKVTLKKVEMTQILALKPQITLLKVISNESTTNL